jgi:hypothetical protein
MTQVIKERKLKKLIRLGPASVAVTIPLNWVEEENLNYVWLEKRNSEIIIRKAEVQ